MDILVMVGQLLLGLSILVGVHEAGHMISAKWFGMRVEKFSIGFPPKIFGKQIGETEYMIGAVPLGGFVKITGMVDESLDTDALSGPPQPYEFRAKPAWQRLIVMLGGIIVNVLTGIIIFSLLLYAYGETYVPAREAERFGVIPNELGQKIGFRTGDKIVKINGRPFERFNDVYAPDVVLGSASYYTVERNGQLVDIPVPVTIMNELSDQDKALFVAPRMPFKVKRVVPGNNASKAGIQANDRIVRIGDTPIQFFDELQAALLKYAGKTAPIQVQRGSQVLPLQVAVSESGKVGLEQEPLLKLETRDYSLVESFPEGTKQAFGIITTQAKAFGKILKRQASASESLGGPIEIAQQYGSTWDWPWFWRMTGMLSMVLAFMNLLPIPALDGGHVMFLTYEMLSGRKPSDKFLENAQKVGMVLILSLMVFILVINPIMKAMR
ncbi:RIP metalloprotease RseP [Hymenobacter sp. CRA2]|uniref:RIP metalloprotease RseP n=1 Tax=Hymenobacter sp. CRA2 TaxID=1955620 RepID=UPI00098F5EBC|nr:RIP metalloprotease RseP [Hymenobacter sp. CRA2]OON69123.1 RIP metalloprotease RseP [Hymenobacter sp. CRA2]